MNFHQIKEETSNMRTTLNLEDEAFATAQAYAKSRGIKLGQAISELIVRGSSGSVPMHELNGVWVFNPPSDTPTISSEQVKLLLEESL
jgi:hypothetical protein